MLIKLDILYNTKVKKLYKQQLKFKIIYQQLL